MLSFNQEPDKPQPFGYKVCWFALKASDPASVLDAFEFGKATPANWASGLAAAYGNTDSQGGDPWVFISPPVDGWILAPSVWLPYPAAAEDDVGKKFQLLFSRLMKRFDDVQFFGSHRVSDFVAWARAVNGKPSRLFASGDGEVLVNTGGRTSEEAKLGFADLTGLSPSDAQDEIFRLADERNAKIDALVAGGLSPKDARARMRQDSRDPMPDEGDVIDLATLWSINPLRLGNEDHQPGCGLAVPLPKTMMAR